MMKRGQFQISFGMIFSIIVIIAILGVAFYVLKNFLQTSQCAEIGLFYEGLKDHVDKAWQSTFHKDAFRGTLPRGIEFVCFGTAEQTPQREDRDLHRELTLRARDEENVFLAPREKACDASLASFSLKHAKTEEFFCVPVIDHEIEIKTKKESVDALVTVSGA